MNIRDRTGQVWIDHHDTVGGVFLVLEPGAQDPEGDFHHPVVYLDGKRAGRRTVWYEYAYVHDWEFDHQMERIT